MRCGEESIILMATTGKGKERSILLGNRQVIVKNGKAGLEFGCLTGHPRTMEEIVEKALSPVGLRIASAFEVFI